jgi:hypothetical protein
MGNNHFSKYLESGTSSEIAKIMTVLDCLDAIIAETLKKHRCEKRYNR